MLIAAVAAAVLLVWGDIHHIARRQRAGHVDEAAFLASIAANLRAGQSMRAALHEAAELEEDGSLRLVGKLALAGAPLAEMGPLLERLPVNGSRVSAAMQVVEISGGRSAAVFGGLADRAGEESNRRRERRVLTAQARLSAAIVAGLPFVGVLLGGFSRIATLAAAGVGGFVVAAVGLGMQAVGVAVVWRMAIR